MHKSLKFFITLDLEIKVTKFFISHSGQISQIVSSWRDFSAQSNICDYAQRLSKGQFKSCDAKHEKVATQVRPEWITFKVGPWLYSQRLGQTVNLAGYKMLQLICPVAKKIKVLPIFTELFYFLLMSRQISQRVSPQ